MFSAYKQLIHLFDAFPGACRPHWEKCAQYVEGGADRWNDISQNRSSDELVDVLLAEMTGQDIAIIQAGASTGAEYFQGQVPENMLFST